MPFYIFLCVFTGEHDPPTVKRELGSRGTGPSPGGFTLDDIQQVLSANCPLPGVVACATNDNSSVDERALKEITAYLQSETGVTNREGTATMPGHAAVGGYTAPGGSDSGVMVRMIGGPAAGPPEAPRGPSAGDPRPTDPAGGGTILVTDSNLPYLQQFLPNLQTVMQSVQSLVRCVPGGDAAAQQQQRSVSLPSLAAPKPPPDDGGPVSVPKKRKRSGKSAGPDGLSNSFAAPKDGDQAKVEPDSASAAAGFACGLCSRTFSKRLGLSVHIQRAHGHRRSSESVEPPAAHNGGAAAAAEKRPDGGGVKNCFLKTAKVELRGPPGDAGPVCMCDGCGDIVSGLEAHAAVCVGRQSPPKDAALKAAAEKPDPSSLPAVSTNTAVVEMLQLAEHFLRQHVPVPTEPAPGVVEPPPLHMLSPPPPYSGAETRGGVPAAEIPASPVVGILPVDLPASAGKEIIYEGSRMREYVEYQCEACLLTFTSSSMANSHVADHHSSASVSAYRVYACLSCSLRYRDPRIMRHHVVYLCAQADGRSQQLYPCAYCHKTFMTAEYMAMHVRVRHGGGATASPPVQCVLPAPPGASSVPSLDQLVSQFRRTPGGAEPTSNHAAVPLPLKPGLASDLVRTAEAPSGQSAVDGRPPPGDAASKPRSSKAKGILYKNVFMQCEGTYYCSACGADLTGRESKRRHRQMPCGDPKTASYSRRYSYVCPYCSERFPSQKLCRQHQIDECLPLMGIGTAELGVGEHRCPLCPKTCFGFPALKGHIMQAHHLPKDETAKLLAEAAGADSREEFNGVLSPAGIASPGTAATSGQPLYPDNSVTPATGMDSDDEPDHPKELFPALYDAAAPADDAARPAKRNRKSRANEFFVMMFRNYPILAKGVSMCRSCAGQLEPSATAESHAPVCGGTAPPDVRRSTLFRCTHCTATFWRAKDCRTHQLESCLPAHGVKVERLTEPSVACPMCDVRSYNRSGLMSHMKFRHALDTDGVRQVMDRCGIRKSVPPTPDDIVAPSAASPSDGSLSMEDDAGVVGMLAPASAGGASSMDALVDVLPPADDVDASSTWRTAGILMQRSSADVCTNLSN